MRCYACDVILTTPESVRKFKHSKSFTELCSQCLKTMDVDTVDSDNIVEEDFEEKLDE